MRQKEREGTTCWTLTRAAIRTQPCTWGARSTKWAWMKILIVLLYEFPVFSSKNESIYFKPWIFPETSGNWAYCHFLTVLKSPLKMFLYQTIWYFFTSIKPTLAVCSVLTLILHIFTTLYQNFHLFSVSVHECTNYQSIQ